MVSLVIRHPVQTAVTGPFEYSILTRSPDFSSSKRQQENEFRSDLTAFVRTSSVDKPEVYSQALSLLDSMRNAPSCNRLATSALLDSCQSIEGTTTGAESSLEHVRSIYAAQLAVCEIVSAGSAVPSQCKPFQSVNAEFKQRGRSGAGTKGKGKPTGANEIESRHLSQCLQSLESRPQWWTSYSNSRQNAVVMCQAARADIEKGEPICRHCVI